MVEESFAGIKKYFVFFVVCGLVNVPRLKAEKETLASDSCHKLFIKSPASSVQWTAATDDKTCYICNSLHTKRSWFYITYVRYSNVKLLHADITFQVTNCRDCKNQHMKVYALYDEAMTKGGSSTDDDLSKLPFLKKLTVSKENKKEHKHIQFVPPKDSKGVSLVFLAEGGCLVVYKIELKYFYCKETYINAVRLPKTSSPSNQSVVVNATCAEDTVLGGEGVYGLCSSTGRWDVPSRCLCKKGYAVTSKGCQACKSGTYKDKAGNKNCEKCPANSQSGESAMKCSCNEGYYRFIGENHTQPCYGVPSEVQDIEFPSKTDTSVEITWNPPSERTGSGVLVDIQCFKCDGDDCSTPCVKEKYFPSKVNISGNNATVSNLGANMKYLFVFVSKNKYASQINQTYWSRTSKHADTKAATTQSQSDLPMAVIIAVPVVVIILIMIIIVLVILLKKRRKFGRRFTMLRRVPNGQGAFPLIGEKNYIDPTTYDDPERAVSEFAKELNRDQIEFVSIIGGGEFGDVYKGVLRRTGEPATNVAIKTLKAGSTHKNRKDFLLEASIMGQFKNLNVIALEGVVTKSVPLLIVTEFMENGSLDEYLKVNDGVLKSLQLLGMSRGVASGMAYLAGMHFVHRDLAARNVLVNVNLACKVADFGLSRDVGETPESEYETQGGKIAVRWTAPEAIRHRKFSTASDVWSYGILLWETMSFAERPYWEWGNLEVIERVESGYRLPPPMNCPKTVHQLMIECWTEERTERPSFVEIVRILDEWIRSPEKLDEEHVKVKKGDPLDFATFKTVKDWLDAFKMGMYASNFTKAGFRNLDDVSNLSENELLSKVGVTLVGHRHKIYQQIKELNKHLTVKRDDSVRI